MIATNRVRRDGRSTGLRLNLVPRALRTAEHGVRFIVADDLFVLGVPGDLAALDRDFVVVVAFDDVAVLQTQAL